MSAVPIIVGLLRSQPAILALLPKGRDGIYAIAAPTGQPRPAIVIIPTSESETANLAGQHDNQPEARFLVMLRAATALEALSIGDTVVRLLKDARTLDGQSFTILRENIDRTEMEAESEFTRVVGFRIFYSN